MFKRLYQLFTGDYEAEQKLIKRVFGTMLIAGIIALAASFVLTLEKFHLYENPDAILSCSFNVVLNCSTVMQTWQSSLFGFPNMIIGLMAFAVVITVAVVGLTGIKMPRWFLVATQIGYLLGAIFAYWLFFQSMYAIQVLCPWCLVVTVTTTLIFSSMLHYNLKQNTFNLPKKADKKVQQFLSGGYHQLVVAGWLALMVALVFIKFGEALFA